MTLDELTDDEYAAFLAWLFGPIVSPFDFDEGKVWQQSALAALPTTGYA